MIKKILTFGEPILINYILNEDLVDFSNSYFSLGGSEINTSVVLKKLDVEPYLLTCLPNNDIGNYYFNYLKELELNTDFILKKDKDLIASMYIKNNKVFYQRKYSSFYFLSKNDINFDEIFSINYDCLHLTGITPLLSENCKEIWIMILEKSLKLNIPVSIDLNYRPAIGIFKDLWFILKKYLSRIEIFIISEKNIKNICEIEGITYSNSFDNNLLEISKKLKINILLLCLKEKKGDYQIRYSVLVKDNNIYYSDIKKHKPSEEIGGGDSYIGCFLNYYLNNKDDIISNLNYADIYTILNQNNKGNFSKVSKKELELNSKNFK